MKELYKKKFKNFIKTNDEVAYRLKGYKVLMFQKFSWAISDANFVKLQYRFRTGKKLNLYKPNSYNEKLQWMKLNYQNKLLNKYVDKYLVRDYVENLIGNSVLIPIIGVYETIEDIDFTKLPEKFVMKLNNGSSFNFICKEKTEENIKKIKKRFRLWTNLNYFYYGREWAYRDVKNRIICEQLLEPSSGEPPQDYRFFCFQGEVKFIAVDSDSIVNNVKTSNYSRNLYDKNWNLIDATIQYPQNGRLDSKPERLNEMIEMAEILAENFPGVRVDFYYFDKKIYFGELTFYHGSGYQKIEPSSFAEDMSNWLKIKKD